MLSRTLEQLGNCLHPKWKFNIKLQSHKNKLCAARYGNVWRWAKQHGRSVAVVPNAGTEHSSMVRLPAVTRDGSADNSSCCTRTVVCHKLFGAARWKAMWGGTYISKAQGSLNSICCYWPRRVIVPLMLQIDFCMKLESFLILGGKVAPMDWD